MVAPAASSPPTMTSQAVAHAAPRARRRALSFGRAVEALGTALRTFEGKSLRQTLTSDGPMQPRRALHIATQIAASIEQRRVVGSLAYFATDIVEPGVIRHVGAQPFITFGELDNRLTIRAERLRDVMRSAGINADISEDIHKSMWSKAVFITPMSGIGAASRVPVGVWRTMPETRRMAENAIREVVAVATARGVRLDDDIVTKVMQRYDGLPADATSSLQRDVMSGKPSELDAQLGAAVRLGRESPINPEAAAHVTRVTFAAAESVRTGLPVTL